jgi:hypothetical protein
MILVVGEQMRLHAGAEPVVQNMIFHSMEMVVDASPYSRGEITVVELYRRLEGTLEHLHGVGAEFATLSAVPAPRIPSATPGPCDRHGSSTSCQRWRWAAARKTSCCSSSASTGSASIPQFAVWTTEEPCARRSRVSASLS